MDLKKLRGKKGDSKGSNDSSRLRPGRSGAAQGDELDMSPGGPYSAPRPGVSGQRRSSGPRNIQETEAWRQSRTGLQNMWANYKEVLKSSWQRMPRADQEALVTRLCQIITIGVSVIVLMFFYSFLPKLIAIFAVPAVLFAAFWAGTKLVAPIIIVQYEQYMNQEF